MRSSGGAAEDGRPAAVGVVIPARNEQELLPACLRSVVEAAGRLELPTRIVVALDRCTDRSAAIAAEFRAAGCPVRGVPVSRPGVGAARAAGVRALLAELGTDLWLACTDADSEVPPDWLTRQLAHVRRGADVVVGTVHVEHWTGHPPNVPSRYLAGYHAVPGHRHVHGANLGLRAEHYLAVGGFPELDCDEDVALVDRLEALGSVLVWAADAPVTTSARMAARAPHGFATHLLSLAQATDVG